jgi:hypothetical protein
MEMEITTPEQAKEAIKRWLSENRHTLVEMDDDKANFHFVIDYPMGTSSRQSIIQPKMIPNLIWINKSVMIAPEHIKKLKAMEPKARSDFYSYIRRDLLFLENHYRMSINDKGILENIQFTYELYLDGLTKTNLFRGLLLNHRTFMYIVLSFRGRFEGLEPGGPDTSPMFG